MSFIIRRTLRCRLSSLNSAGAALQPRTSVAFSFPRFVTASATSGPASNSKPERIQSTGLNDTPPVNPEDGSENKVDWSKSFHGLSVEPFKKETADVLLAPLDPEDVEVKPGMSNQSHGELARVVN